MTQSATRAAIIGTGSCLPEKILTNQDFEKLVDTSDEWIFTRTGIRERHIAAPNQTTSDLGAEAARRALDAAKVKPEEVSLLIVATITPDFVFPSTACLIQNKIGAKNTGGFDLSAACAGFVYGLIIGARFVEADPRQTVLVVGAETLSRITDYTDRSSCILFGDGAGAAVLRAATDGRGVMASEIGIDGSGAEFMKLPAGGSALPASAETVAQRLHYMKINGRETFRFAVVKMADLVESAIRDSGLTMDDVALIVPHQVNSRILQAAAERLHISMDKIYTNIDRVGNTSAASAPIALDEAVRAGRIKSGDAIVMVAFGGALLELRRYPVVNPMSKLAFLFPGQGAQTVGMGKDFADAFPAAAQVYRQADEILGWKLSALCFTGPKEELDRTARSQPAILVTGVAVLAAMKEAGLSLAEECSVTAGLSLGEYTALVMAGALPFADALRLVEKRGRFMEEACRQCPGTMMSVLGLDDEIVEALCAQARADGMVVAANFNAPGQVVISGEIRAVERAADLARQRGAKRVLPLAVSGAFHSPLMEPASERLEAELQRAPISACRIPVISNVSAEPVTQPDDIRLALARQLKSPVRWSQSMKYLVATGADRFIEVAPGKVLSGLLKRAAPDARIDSLASADSLKALLKA